MKKLFNAMIVASMLLVLLVPAAFAAGPTGTYVSGITCINLEATQGTFTITFYDTAGAEVTTVSDTIASNGVKLYFTPNISGLSSPYVGSAVVSSSTQMSCSVNTQTNSGLIRVGTSNGVADTATGLKVYAPQVMNNLSGFSTYVAVQNTTGSAANVTAKYFNTSGTEVYSATKSVPAYSTFVFYQDGDTDGDAVNDLPAGFIGSATFESAANLAGTVALYNLGTEQANSQFLSYNTFTTGSAVVYGPRLVKNLSGVGFTSGFTCQNVGTASVNMVADISMLNQANSTTVNTTLSRNAVLPGQSWGVYMGSTGNATLDAIGSGVGSAKITATGTNASVACIFNEDNRTTYSGVGSTYGGFPDGTQTDTIYFAQVTALGGSSYRGGFQLAPTGGVAATCTYTFSNGDVVTNQAVPLSGASIFAENMLVNNKTSFNGSVVAECNQPVVGIYNLAALSIAGDTFATNNGINR